MVAKVVKAVRAVRAALVEMADRPVAVAATGPVVPATWVVQEMEETAGTVAPLEMEVKVVPVELGASVETGAT